MYTDCKSVYAGSIPTPALLLRAQALRRMNPAKCGAGLPALALRPRALYRTDTPVHYVFLLKSELYANRRHVGATANLKQPLADHNSKKSLHTAQ